MPRHPRLRITQPFTREERGRKMIWVDAYDDNMAPIQIPLYDKGEQDKHYWPRIGQTLYYKDKRTGEINTGVVAKPGNFKFRFWFEGGQVRLDKEVIGKRLFVSEADARNYGKMEKDEGS